MDAFIERMPEGEGSLLCKDARKQRAAKGKDYSRFQNLVYALAAAATVALIASIVLVVLGQQTAGIVSGVGAVVTGAGALFVRRERDRAAREETAAWKEVVKLCKPEIAMQDEAARLAVGLGSDQT